MAGFRLLGLTHYLEAYDEPCLVMTLSHIEEVVGEPLPRSAWRYPTWWSNAAPHAAAWVAAGYRASRAGTGPGQIAFIKDGTDPVRSEGAGRPRLYGPLCNYLLTRNDWIVELTFADIAQILGRAQPRPYGKASSRVPRDIPIVRRLRPVLDRLAAYSRCEHLLTGPDGLPLSYETWRNRLSASANAAGYPQITTHVLRHTAASLWIKAGAAPFLVMKAGGWASLDMVSKVYGHLWPSDVVELGRKVDALDWDALD